MKGIHLMLDLETLSTAPDAAIVAIGAVIFNSKEVYPYEHYSVISIESSMESGGTVDGSTIRWWMNQEDKARNELFAGRSVDIDSALYSFRYFLNSHNVEYVWGNGVDFDNVILASAYRRAKLPCPWSGKNNRCYKTVIKMFPDVPRVEPVLKHHALHDAKAQAQHLVNIFNCQAYKDGL